MGIDTPGMAGAAGAAPDAKNQERFFDTEHIKADIKGRTVRNGALTVGYEFFKQVLSLGVTPVLARLLTTADYGLVGMVTVITSFITIFSNMGLSSATIQRKEINQEQVSALFWINVVTGMALGVLIALCAPLIAWFYGEPRLVGITLGIAACLFFSGVTTQHKSLLKRQMRFTELRAVDLVSTLVAAVVTISSAMAGFGYWALILNWAVQVPIDIVGTWLVCRWRPSRPGRAAGLRSLLAFGGNVTGFKLVTYLTRNIDNLLIGRLFGPQQLGVYIKAYGLLLLPISQVNLPISSVMMPSLSRLADDPERYRQAYRKITSSICIITIPLVAFMMATSDWIVALYLGEQWTAVSAIFPWLGISGLIESFTFATVWLFTSQGRAREQFRWGLIGSTVMIAAIVAGLPWGPVGVAISYGFVGLFVRAPLLFWYVGRSGPVRTKDIYRGLAPFACAAAAILATLFSFRRLVAIDSPVLGLLVAGALTGLVGLAVLVLFPVGRQAIRDSWSIPSLLLRRKKIV